MNFFQRDEQTTSTRTNNNEAPGILSLVVPPLPYYPFDLNILEEKQQKRNKRSVTNNFVVPTMTAPLFDGRRQSSEFTLFLFMDVLHCRNSQRIRPIVSKFAHQMNESGFVAAATNSNKKEEDREASSQTLFSEQQQQNNDDDEKTMVPKLQCICIPNDPTEFGMDSNCRGTGFWCLPFDHPNKIAIIRLLAASVVPSMFVINNKTGRLVTDQGLDAIEYNPEGAMDAWRKGQSGVPWLRTIFKF